MSGAALLARCRGDSYARLKWQVLERVGICPLSLRGRLLLSRRAVLRAACQLILAQEPQGGTAVNGRFDAARYDALREQEAGA